MLVKFIFLIFISITFLNTSVFSTESNDPEFTPWIEEAIFYAVYVRSFQDSDGDG